MLIVIVIIGILAWALIPRIWGARDKANDVAREADVRSISTALASYISEHNTYPADIYAAGAWVFVAESWMAQALTDPVTEANYGYKMLNNGTHYVVCATLSDGSTAWNFAADPTANEAITTLDGLTEGEWGFFCAYN